jgi:hypothetical protein
VISLRETDRQTAQTDKLRLRARLNSGAAEVGDAKYARQGFFTQRYTLSQFESLLNLPEHARQP